MTLITIYKGTYKHGNKVTSIDIQKSILASGSFDHLVQVWNIEKQIKLYEVDHGHAVYCVKIVDELLLASGGIMVKIWNLKSGNLLHKLQLPNMLCNFDLDPQNTLLAVAHYHGVSIWDFSSLKSFDGLDYSVRSPIMDIKLQDVMDVRFNEPGTRLIVGQYDGKVFKVDLY